MCFIHLQLNPIVCVLMDLEPSIMSSGRFEPYDNIFKPNNFIFDLSNAIKPGLLVSIPRVLILLIVFL